MNLLYQGWSNSGKECALILFDLGTPNASNIFKLFEWIGARVQHGLGDPGRLHAACLEILCIRASYPSYAKALDTRGTPRTLIIFDLLSCLWCEHNILNYVNMFLSLPFNSVYNYGVSPVPSGSNHGTANIVHSPVNGCQFREKGSAGLQNCTSILVLCFAT